jgi:hypothetical protein
MTRVIAIAFFYAALAVLLAPATSVAANDGEALPIYPHTNKGRHRSRTDQREGSHPGSHSRRLRTALHDRLGANRGPLVSREATQVVPAERAIRDQYPIHLRHACGYDWAGRRPDTRHTRTQTLIQ